MSHGPGVYRASFVLSSLHPSSDGPMNSATAWIGDLLTPGKGGDPIMSSLPSFPRPLFKKGLHPRNPTETYRRICIFSIVPSNIRPSQILRSFTDTPLISFVITSKPFDIYLLAFWRLIFVDCWTVVVLLFIF